MKRVTGLLVGILIAVAGGALAQQSSIGGMPSRPKFQQVTVQGGAISPQFRIEGTASVGPHWVFHDTTSAANARRWHQYAFTNQLFNAASLDNDTTFKNWLVVTRNAASSAITDLSFGNATDNPPFNFLGTGLSTIGGSLLSTKTGGGNVAAVRVEAAQPSLAMRATGGGADAKQWDFTAGVGANVFSGRVVNDANSAVASWVDVTRSGATITNVSFPNGTVTAAALDVNGPLVLSGNPVTTVQAAFKPSATARSSTVTLAADPHLTGVGVPGAGDFLISGLICFHGTTTGTQGIKMRYEFSATATLARGQYLGNVNGVAVADGGFLALDANQISFATIGTTNGRDCVDFSHTFRASGIGVIELQWAQVSSNANATNVVEGSYIKVEQLN